MAKLSSIQKNSNRLKLIKKFKSKRNSLKAKVMQKDLTMDERFEIQNKLNDLPRNSSSIRELSMSGDLPGVVKSSW